tara:strand:- start:18421 stop:19569 length:1149 start_codon:yes stop_codon:yes gene_type:complete
MKYLSICSGIESVGVAWHPLGFKCVGLSEIDPFRSAVLNYHYPEVKNHGDFTKIKRQDLPEQPDVLVGGTPCATFSIAGLRKGLAEDRGNLALEFIKLAERIKPKWILWENVPGILSSNKGKDLATFFGALAELRYGFAYRVLNTEFVRTQRFPRALPQRRRRIFVVGCLGDWRSAAEVLFDRETMSSNSTPRRKKSEEIARKSGENSKNSFEKLSKTTIRQVRSDEYTEDNVAGTLAARDYKSATDLVIMRESQTGSNGKSWNDDGVSWSLTAHDRYTVVETNTPDKVARVYKEEVSPTLNAMTGGNRQPVIMRNNVIRRLTPIEVERLQGFPDNYTQVPYRNKPKEDAPVSKRYEACGRAMSVNVMEWLGSRIQKVHEKY